jgi:hypothetical protein
MQDDSTTPTVIDPNCNVDDFFRELVTEAVKSGGFETSTASETYLVGLLADSAKPNSATLNVMGRSSFTLMLAHALECQGADRFEKLRLLGDGVLYVSGFFSERLTSRGLEPAYVKGVGATAYGRAALMLRSFGGSSNSSGPDVFTELADNFGMYVNLVNNVAEELRARAVRDDVSLLEAYERWLRGPSKHVAELLLARGVLPTRQTPGVH